MCGIVGSVVRTGFAREHSSSREKALSVISHRGPDASGECTRGLTLMMDSPTGSNTFGHQHKFGQDLSVSVPSIYGSLLVAMGSKRDVAKPTKVTRLICACFGLQMKIRKKQIALYICTHPWKVSNHME